MPPTNPDHCESECYGDNCNNYYNGDKIGGME